MRSILPDCRPGARFSGTVFVAMLSVASGQGYAQVSIQPGPDTPHWADELMQCGGPEPACIGKVLGILHKDHPALVSDHRILQADMLLLSHPDDAVHAGALVRIRTRIDAVDNPLERAELIASAGGHIIGLRPAAAAAMLTEALQLLDGEAPSKTRDEVHAELASWGAQLPGNLQLAERLASEISNPALRLKALADITAGSPEASGQADRLFEEIFATLAETTTLPGEASTSLSLAMKAISDPAHGEQLIARVERRAAEDRDWAGDHWNVERFVGTLEFAQTTVLIRSGEYPLPGDRSHPFSGRGGTYRMIVEESLAEGRSDLAQAYYDAISQRSDRDVFNFHMWKARSHLKKGEYAEARAAIDVATSMPPSSKPSSTLSRRFIEFLAEIGREASALGFPAYDASILQAAPCQMLDAMMSEPVDVLASGETEQEDIWDDEALDMEDELDWSDADMEIGQNLDALVKLQCNEQWLKWITDPRLAEEAPGLLIDAMRARLWS